jgi:hypothetical protein
MIIDSSGSTLYSDSIAGWSDKDLIINGGTVVVLLKPKMHTVEITVMYTLT